MAKKVLSNKAKVVIPDTPPLEDRVRFLEATVIFLLDRIDDLEDMVHKFL